MPEFEFLTIGEHDENDDESGHRRQRLCPSAKDELEPRAVLGKSEGAGGSFADILEATVGRAQEAGKKSDALAMRAASGNPTDLVEVVTAVAESEAALESLVAVRDRVVAAYEEIMRMPI